MVHFFTEYNEMVGKRPRQAYFKELQDAVIALQGQVSGLVEGPAKDSYKEASEPIYRYQTGASTFAVMEDVSSGYPTTDGIVETLYLTEFRNIQHFFTQGDDELSGETYTRQWKEEFRQWSPFEKLLMERDLVDHVEDTTVHITEKDRYRILGYVHDQIAATTEWIITHHLGKFPTVAIVDSGGNAVVGDIQYVSEDIVKATFTQAFSGKAFLS